jgi:hypothetical protein
MDPAGLPAAYTSRPPSPEQAPATGSPRSLALLAERHPIVEVRVR